MALPRRRARLEDRIQAEVSEILNREINDPRIGFVTITRVIVSADLKVAKIYTSVLGSPQEVSKSLDGLHSSVGFIRRELGKRIRLRHTPEIFFKLDKAIEEGTRILELMGEFD